MRDGHIPCCSRFLGIRCTISVSYTHLDVYKRHNYTTVTAGYWKNNHEQGIGYNRESTGATKVDGTDVTLSLIHILNMMGMAAAVLFSSCVKDTLYDTPHPDSGKIAVTADWSARGEGIDIPCLLYTSC